MTKLADVSFDTRGDVLVAHVTGEIDMSNAREIGTAVLEATPNGAMGIVLDLSEVDYLDSAGIYVVFEMRNRLRARGQVLRLSLPEGSPVDDALRLAGVQGHVEVAATVDESVAGLQESSEPPGGE